jgi:isocitrate lyase
MTHVMPPTWWCGVDIGVLYMNNRLVGKPQEKVMISIAASLPSVVKPRFIELVGERTKLPKVDAASFATLQTMAPENLLAYSFAPVATWNLHITQPRTLSQLTVRLSISPVCCK